jgi:plastocyanin
MATDERDQLVQTYLDGGIGRRVFVKRLLASGISLAAAVSYADLLAGGTARARTRSAAMTAEPPSPTLSGFYNFYMTVVDNAYAVPSLRVIKRGDSVSWAFQGAHVHSVTERSGMHYFDSGFQPANRIEYTSVFPAAGTFLYHCKDPAHAGSMTGTVKVPVGRKPVSGTPGTQFTIFWGQKGKTAPPGYVHDVQIKRPGESSFHAFRTGVTAPSTHIAPTATGVYQFRARLRNKANGKTSGWSPIAKITVAS